MHPGTHVAIPTGDRLVVSRERLARIREVAGERAESRLRYTLPPGPQQQLAAAKSAYAKGVVDVLAFLTDPDHPDPMLADILGLEA